MGTLLVWWEFCLAYGKKRLLEKVDEEKLLSVEDIAPVTLRLPGAITWQHLMYSLILIWVYSYLDPVHRF